jgi:hypothetical protein
MLYLAAGIATTAALLATHKRGPGAQLGPLMAVTLPLLVAGLDATASGYVATGALQQVAVAPPAAKQALVNSGADAMHILQGFSGLSVLLALGLACLGPVASAQRSRDLIRGQVGAIALSMGSAALVILTAGAYMLPFTWGQ